MNIRRIFGLVLFTSFSTTLKSQETPNNFPCGYDKIIEAKILASSEFQEEFQNFQWLISEKVIRGQRAFGKQKATPIEGNWYIPVVFHIIHEGVGTASNIPYSNVVHQLQVLNEAFSGYVTEESEFNGVDTHLRFCLATETGNELINWTDPNEPGVMRYDNPDLSNTNWQEILANEVQTSQNFFPFESFLNIYVVNNVGNVFGPAYYDLITETDLETLEINVIFDGIVTEYDLVGTDDLGDSGLSSWYNKGRAIVHEVGHYLSLLHTWSTSCGGTNDSDCMFGGDYVCDTPPVLGNDNECQPEIDNTCTENITYSDLPPNNYLVPNTATDYFDMDANFMGYAGPDLCRKTFTQGQADKMIYMLNEIVYREYLTSIPNLVATGIFGPNGCVQGEVLTAIFDVEPQILCTDQQTLFTGFWGEGFSATSWTWDFGDGNVTTDSGDGEIEHTYQNPGDYDVTLTVTDGTSSLSQGTTIIVSDCHVPEPEQSHWIYGNYVGLDFTPGLPVVDGIAYDDLNDPNDGFTMSSNLTSICQSDPETGELLFYTNGNKIWQADGTVVEENLGQPQFTMACVPYSDNQGQYFMIVPSTMNGAKFHVIGVDGNSVVTLVESGEIVVQNGNATSNQIFAIPHCNGHDYWMITNDGNNLLVYLLSQNGLSNADMTNSQWENNLQADTYPLAQGGSLTFLEMYGSTLVELRSSGSQRTINKYYFDNQTGTVEFIEQNPAFTFTTISTFSPRLTADMRFLYFYGKPSALGLRSAWRYDLELSELQDLECGESAAYTASFQRGPEPGLEKKMYYSVVDDSTDPILNTSTSVFYEPQALDPLQTQFQLSALNYEGYPLMHNELCFPDFIDGEKPPTFEVEATISNQSCPEAMDASIELDIDVGCETYEVSWTGPEGFSSQNEDIFSLAPGTYTAEFSAPDCSCAIQTQVFIIPLITWSYDSDVVVSSSNDETYGDAWVGNTNTFNADLIFSNGVNVVVGNLNQLTAFIFNSVSDLVIEEGANVTFVNCVFSSCGENWGGMDVKADRTVGSPTSGKLTLNTCTIEYAREAIYTRDVMSGGNIGTRAGGDIYCYRTSFLNNQRAFTAVHATDKLGQNLPSIGFRECYFGVDDQMHLHFPDNQGAYNAFKSHAWYDESYGYGYQGCVLENNMTEEIQQWDNKGKAIWSAKSVYGVTASQISINEPAVRSEFRGFDVAIDANQASKRAVMVTFSDFEKNRVGIRLTNMPFFQVYENTFNIGELIDVDPDAVNNPNIQTPNAQDEVLVGYENGNEEFAPIWYEGIFVSGGHSFVLAENTFDGSWENEGGVSNDFVRIGIRVRDTKTKDDEVRLNSFTDLTVANLANGDNADAANSSGLRYICNTHTDNWFDIQVDDYAGAGDVAIDIVQDDFAPVGVDPDQWSADNTFTQDLNILEEDGRIWNDGIGITYYFEGVGSIRDPGGEVTVLTVNPSDLPGIFGNLCTEEWEPDTQHSFAQISAWLSKAASAHTTEVTNELLYLSVLDQGSTPELNQEIANAYGSAVLARRDQLLAISPHVSQTVLRTVADRTDQYPHAIALEIFLANPDVLKDNRFMTYLTTKADPMPLYMISILRAASSQTTQRTIILREWNKAQTNYMKNINRALWAMAVLDDYDDDDLAAVLDGMEMLDSEFGAIDQLLDAGNNSAAQSRYNAIAAQFYLPEDLEEETNLFGQWLDLRIALNTAGRTWEQLTTSEINTLYSLVDNYRSWVGRSAMQILDRCQGEIFQLPPAFSQQWDPRALSTSTERTSFIEVFPNPASDLVNILIDSPVEIEHGCLLHIVDNFGQLIYTTEVNHTQQYLVIDVGVWSSGLYAYEITLPVVGTQSGKFNVQH